VAEQCLLLDFKGNNVLQEFNKPSLLLLIQIQTPIHGVLDEEEERMRLLPWLLLIIGVLEQGV